MKKMLLGLTAVFALSAAVPAYANDDKKDDAPKGEKKGKRGKKEEK